MRKLVESTLLSLDGVVEAPGQWALPYFEGEFKEHALTELGRFDAFLLGRVTYDEFVATWPNIKGDPYFDRINAMPKWIATTTLERATWNATPMRGDLVTQVTELKRQPGKDIIKYGTGRLDRTLFQHGLVDELRVSILPVVVGKGRRLFEGVDVAPSLQLAGTKTFRNGVVALTYVPKP